MVIEVGGVEHAAEFNGFTPIAFSREFSVVRPNGASRPKDINEAVGLIIDSMSTCGVPAMSALLEIFYACVKTATPSFGPSFDEWVRSLPAEAFDLQKGDGWAADVMGIVEANFFPSASDGLDAEAAEAGPAAPSGKPK